MRTSPPTIERLVAEDTVIPRGFFVASLKSKDVLPTDFEWTPGCDDLGPSHAAAIRLTASGDEYVFLAYDDHPEQSVEVIGDEGPGLGRRLDLLYATLDLDRKRDLYGDMADQRGDRKLRRRLAYGLGDARRRVRSRCESIWSSFVGRSASV
ncbi:MAG TPA: hypothetical protein VN238_22645 [Solirubrobacteraceae bacterium]|nr:hypothetical protein [Solirubrobacteraceae bacterium]